MTCFHLNQFEYRAKRAQVDSHARPVVELDVVLEGNDPLLADLGKLSRRNA